MLAETLEMGIGLEEKNRLVKRKEPKYLGVPTTEQRDKFTKQR